MARYRSRAREVDAHHWDGTPESAFAIVRWGFALRRPIDIYVARVDAGEVARFYSPKANATVEIHPGDFVVAEDDFSGYYPYTAKEFAQRYALVVDDDGHVSKAPPGELA